ncbi:MAG TPA: hypothetical protein VKV95_11580 [Terriglobia bacterium]|nr:hypothetical protein [Terriglobia bacterium]
MAKAKKIDKSGNSADKMTPMVAATLAGVIYQSRLSNRQAKLNIPDQEVITDVVNIWRTVMDALGRPTK